MSNRREKKEFAQVGSVLGAGKELDKSIPGVAQRRPVTVSAAQPGTRALDLLIRPTRAEIHLGHLKANLETLRRLAGSAGLMAVVKANAYGHGGVSIAAALESWGVNMFAVALVEEAIELRHVGIRSEILVLGGNYEGAYSLMVEYGLTPTLFRSDQSRQLAEAAQLAGTPVTFHLKLDTGMNRLGVSLNELEAFLQNLQPFSSWIRLDGVLSQLATADEPNHPLFSQQLDQFAAATALLERYGHRPRYRHLSNSAALARPDMVLNYGLNLVRPGLLLYGVSPAETLFPQSEFKPVMSWKTEVTRVHEIEVGQTVSYGATWAATRRSRIATLPVGYADGYSRRYSNRADVLVRGKRARVVGRVCMDMSMIDVTDIPNVQVGDEVTLLGSQGDEHIDVHELAKLSDTISYEVLCHVGARVARRVISAP